MKKIPVGILGATGMVGQRFIELLVDHPWFEITALAASDRSLGKPYHRAVQWHMHSPIPKEIWDMPVRQCLPDLPCDLVFSGLDSQVAGEIEKAFAEAGYKVVSNAGSHRMDPLVPLLIPEVNPDHLALLSRQPYFPGAIVTNPNCSVIGLALALKPLIDHWGVEAVQATTLQAISGAGYPGVPSLDIQDNVIPFIANEEAKVEIEPRKIFGRATESGISYHPVRISAHCNRVSVSDGHLACVSVKLQKEACAEDILASWNRFQGAPQQLKLPSAPSAPIHYLTDERHPQPKYHRSLERGMALAVGRLRKCPILDWKFVILSHNTIRGAAGCAVLNAELMVKQGMLHLRGSSRELCEICI